MGLGTCSASVPLCAGTTAPPSLLSGTALFMGNDNNLSSGQSPWREDCRDVQVGMMKAKPWAPLCRCYNARILTSALSGHPSLSDFPFLSQGRDTVPSDKEEGAEAVDKPDRSPLCLCKAEGPTGDWGLGTKCSQGLRPSLLLPFPGHKSPRSSWHAFPGGSVPPTSGQSNKDKLKLVTASGHGSRRSHFHPGRDTGHRAKGPLLHPRVGLGLVPHLLG